MKTIITFENSSTDRTRDASIVKFTRENKHSFNRGSDTIGLSSMKTSSLKGFEKSSGLLH